MVTQFELSTHYRISFLTVQRKVKPSGNIDFVRALWFGAPGARPGAFVFLSFVLTSQTFALYIHKPNNLFAYTTRKRIEAEKSARVPRAATFRLPDNNGLLVWSRRVTQRFSTNLRRQARWHRDNAADFTWETSFPHVTRRKGIAFTSDRSNSPQIRVWTPKIETQSERQPPPSLGPAILADKSAPNAAE